MATLALFGGSFNPPHVAHALACLYVLETVEVDRLWLVPTFQHPFDKHLAPWPDRYEMCRRLAARIVGCEVSSVEAEIGGTSRTLDTIVHLERVRPGDSFLLVVGADVWHERHLWHGFAELERRVRFHVLGRAGLDGPPAMLPATSSSEIRARLAARQDVSSLVPREVLAYIKEKGLYLT